MAAKKETTATKPERLGAYVIEAELGRGGMGVVYRARHSEGGQTVAIKVLPAELAREGGFAARFAHEIKALQKLDHPNIVKLIEPGEDSGYQFYVMEFVAGKGLDKTLIELRRLPWVRAVEIAIDLCHGLKHAHDCGIIHRDLKPANLLLTEDGQVKLTDFGVARIFAGTQLTATGAIIGTAEYMSPEQGEGKPVTRRSDLYSLGVVLYFMITGRPPFLGRSLAELAKLHRYGQFDRPRALVPEIPSWLDELVCQLLEKEPDKRPPDAHVVARRLEIVFKKVALRSSPTVADQNADPDERTIEWSADEPKRVRGAGPATLMQRLMRAQLRELVTGNWLTRLFRKTWVLAIALLLSVGTVTYFAFSNGEERDWLRIERLVSAGDEDDLALLQAQLGDFLRRYHKSPHAEEAQNTLLGVDRDLQRRHFGRLPVVNNLRPPPEPPSELERLYRKALIQVWTEGETAARETLDSIVRLADQAGPNAFIVELAKEDLMSLDLQQAYKLQADGEVARARAIAEQIIKEHSKSLRRQPWVRAARKLLGDEPAQSTAANGD